MKSVRSFRFSPRLVGSGVVLGAAALLAGCVAGPGYSGGGYYDNGYGYSDPAPVYVQPAPVYIEGGYSSGPRYWENNRWNYGPRPGYRPGYGPRPGYAPGPRPGYAPGPRPGFAPGAPRPGFTPPAVARPGLPPAGPQSPGNVPRDTRLIRPFPQQNGGGG